LKHRVGIIKGLKKLVYKCDHCSKEFAKESTLTAHVCEHKRRWLAKDTQASRWGLIAYQQFYQVNQPGTALKDYSNFSHSPYYTAFVKFGSMISNSRPLNPERFIQYIIKSGIKLDHWCREEIYYQYVEETIRTEPAGDALVRSIETMTKWGTTHSADFAHYFKYCSPNLNLHHIREGLMSPWLQLNTVSGRKLLQGLDDQQLIMIDHIIDPQYWRQRFRARPVDLDLVKETITQARIL